MAVSFNDLVKSCYVLLMHSVIFPSHIYNRTVLWMHAYHTSVAFSDKTPLTLLFVLIFAFFGLRVFPVRPFVTPNEYIKSTSL